MSCGETNSLRGRRQVEQAQQVEAHHGQLVAPELAPHQAPLRGAGEGVAVGLGCGGARGAARCGAHQARSSKRIRGSTTTSSMSEKEHPDHGQRRDDHHHAAGQVGVLGAQGAEQQRPHGGQPEHRGNDQLTAEQRRQEATHAADNRVEGDPHRVLVEQRALVQPLGARRDHVLALQLVEQRGAHGADQPRGARHRQHQHRNRQVLQQVHELGEAPGRVDVLAREQPDHSPPQVLGGQVQQHQRDQEVGQSHPDEAEEGGHVVAGGVLVGGGVDAHRHRRQVDQHGGGEGEHQGQRQTLPDQGGDREVPLERLPQVAAEHQVGQPLEVAHRQRQVEAVLLAQQRHRGVVDLAAALQHRRHHRGQVVPRRQLDDDERGQGDEQQQHHHVDEAPHHVLRHRSTPPAPNHARTAGAEARAPRRFRRQCRPAPISSSSRRCRAAPPACRRCASPAAKCRRCRGRSSTRSACRRSPARRSPAPCPRPSRRPP